ncbi:hypothetical protein GQ44DRAFT_442532 [Phaeosphaeriaceae sp. PMI808]|nr:hypothetical protein GQ44DRAFT_442532 [Phaeosphaeriaceae sp. PMI808]
MAGQPPLCYMTTTEQSRDERPSSRIWGKIYPTYPIINQRSSESTPTRNIGHVNAVNATSAEGFESGDEFQATVLATSSHPQHIPLPENRRSDFTTEDSPTHSRASSPEPSTSSAATSPSIYTFESFPIYNTASYRRPPSILKRIKSSMSTFSANTFSTISPLTQRTSAEPADFSAPPEQPEKRFVDSIGIVCPGVCDKAQCTHQVAHFISNFRICQPIEYTTALADHGLTYSDYSRLLTALRNFMEDNSVEMKKGSQEVLPYFLDNQQNDVTEPDHRESTFPDTNEQLGDSRQQANALNRLVEEITTNLRARGVPVMIGVSSFSLFAPNRVSEVHIQILHAPLEPLTLARPAKPEARSSQRLSFIDTSSLDMAESRSMLISRPKLEDRTGSDITKSTKYHQKKSQNRDRSQPWPLWPNAIPSGKRQVMSDHAERYGNDPYYRSWMRADINSTTKSRTYSKYLIEQEDDPLVNKVLAYTEAASPGLSWGAVMKGFKALRAPSPSSVNRAKYEHNRRLECRLNIEHGSRLRILSFGFRHAIYPPHNPEMEELGLTKETYQTIISKIVGMRNDSETSSRHPVSYLLAPLNKIRHRSTEAAVAKVSEYVRELNASQRRIVWTMQKIPGVYDRGLAKDRTEWEISAWNGEDPLELLIQLERWRIVEKRLSAEDDD